MELEKWTLGFGQSSVVDYVLNTCETLVLIPKTKQNPQESSCESLQQATSQILTIQPMILSGNT